MYGIGENRHDPHACGGWGVLVLVLAGAPPAAACVLVDVLALMVDAAAPPAPMPPPPAAGVTRSAVPESSMRFSPPRALLAPVVVCLAA